MADNKVAELRETLASIASTGKWQRGARLHFDGGMGTMLQSRGLPPGVSPEIFSLERPDVLRSIHAEYIQAGADVITTNTFGGTAYKLPSGLEPVDFNRRMAEAARQAAAESGRLTFVAGSIGPTGKFLQPLGDVSFKDMVRAFSDQIRGLAQGGADLILIETQIDLAEARAAVVAARQTCALPIAVCMTYENGATLTGSSPEVCAATLANLGVDIIGTNCSAGPEQMYEIALRLLAVSPVPVLLQPNAGLPELIDGKTVFRLEAERFAELCSRFAEAGAQCLGGCCGTTPAHIRALGQAIDHIAPKASLLQRETFAGQIALSSRSGLLRVGKGQPFALIGERINPTGKKQLAQELTAGETGTALRFAEEQLDAGAWALDVNVGAPGVNEVEMLPALVSVLSSRYQTPLSLDSSNIEAIKAALELYPASALVNSISGEPGRMEALGPLCRDFGTPFILLPLSGKDLPVLASERIKILEVLLEQMERLNIPRSLAIVDALVLSVSANPEAANESFKFIQYCSKTLNLPTVAGLSNVSFGLPARELINANFLSMAAACGMSSAIVNPGNRRIQEAVAATRLLLGQDKDADAFVAQYAGWTSAGTAGSAGLAEPAGAAGALAGAAQAVNSGQGVCTLKHAVIKGLREDILRLTEDALASGAEPADLVNGQLIPGITEVGALYERKEYFLPQLLRSAETMQSAFNRLKPLLEQKSGQAARQKIVTATVEGDIHDIGKNIVNLMLGNHGFEVIDLGKDVSAATIVQAAVDNRADLIGLSALMTTTMVRMRDTIDLLKQRELHDIRVMIGGAVVTESFATSIGAHGYAADAVEAVRVAHKLLN